MTGMNEDPLALLPEIFLLAGALVTLLAGSFLPRHRQWVARVVAAGALVAAAVASAGALGDVPLTVWDGTFTVDTSTGVARLVATLGCLLVIGLGVDELAGDRRESETYTLLLLGTAGATVLAGASDLLVLLVGFLLASIPLYGIVGLARTPRAAEAAMKTYLLGALLGITLMLGVTLLYGLAGGTSYAELSALADAPVGASLVGVAAVVGGLMFKAGAVPGHFWVPDAAQGAGGAAAAFLTSVPKVGALVAVFRLVETLPGPVDARPLIGVLAVASMTLGNLAAFGQDDPRRLLGWSTVSQVGYLLVPVAVAGRTDLALPSLLLYLAAYTVTNLTAFAVTSSLPTRRDLASYRGLATARPWLAAGLVLALLGLVGTPPTAVFAGKVTVAAAAWDGGSAWLAVAVVANTVASLFYYLRWVAPVFARAEPVERTSPGSFVPRPWAAAAAVVAATASVLLGLAAGPAWDLVTPVAG